MDALKQKILIQQLDRKLEKFRILENELIPQEGWIYTIRQAIRMSLRQLGEKLGLSLQGVRKIEISEKEGSISIKKLNAIANILNMKFIYGFIPNDGSIEKMIEKKVCEIAESIVNRTSKTMSLEDQEVSEERIIEAIKERAKLIKDKMPRYLWD